MDVDVRVRDEGSIILLVPISEAAREWVDENLELESWQWFGGGAAIDRRYAGDIINGMIGDGLALA